MTHPGSGNSAWQDWPSTSTLVSAAALEGIEAGLDALQRPADGGMAVYVPATPTAPAVGQAISAAGSADRIAFGTALRTTSLVTRNAVSPGHTFTLNRTAMWSISMNAGMQNTATGSQGIKRAHLTQDGNSTVALSLVMANLTTNAIGVGVFGGDAWTGRLADGTLLTPFAWTAAADQLVAANTSLTITYLGPA